MNLPAIGKMLFGPYIHTASCEPDRMSIINRVGAIAVPTTTLGLQYYQSQLTLPKIAIILATFTIGVVTAIYFDINRAENECDEYALAQCLNPNILPSDAAMSRVLLNPSLTKRLLESAKKQAPPLSLPMQKVAHTAPTKTFLAFLKLGMKIDYYHLLEMMKSKEDSAKVNLKGFLDLKNPKLIDYPEYTDARTLLNACPVEMVKDLVTFGIDPNVKGSLGTTALKMAEIKGDQARVTALLNAGAHLNVN